MNQILAQYHQRSPRYILLPHDQCLIRVAGPKQTPWEEGTEIRNISQSGLCFTAPNILLPFYGEYIRVQFEVPGSKQMACHAKVVRIEELSSEVSLIAIEFDLTTPAQQWNISQGLKKKRVDEASSIIEIDRDHKESKKDGLLFYLFYFSVGVSLFLSAFLLIALFRFLSDPLWLDKMTWAFHVLWTYLLSFK